MSRFASWGHLGIQVPPVLFCHYLRWYVIHKVESISCHCAAVLAHGSGEDMKRKHPFLKAVMENLHMLIPVTSPWLEFGRMAIFCCEKDWELQSCPALILGCLLIKRKKGEAWYWNQVADSATVFALECMCNTCIGETVFPYYFTTLT